MNNSLLSLRKLRYRYLASLIGKELMIPGITEIEGSILATVSNTVTGNFSLKGSVSNLTSVMRKYGFLDVTLVSSEPLLSPADRINRAVLRELGYSPRPEDPVADLEPFIKEQLGSDRSCLEVLGEDIREQSCFLRLFLNSKWSQNSLPRMMEYVSEERARDVPQESIIDSAAPSLAEKMSEWFPATFTIEDACLSNSDAIWLAKHCYL